MSTQITHSNLQLLLSELGDYALTHKVMDRICARSKNNVAQAQLTKPQPVNYHPSPQPTDTSSKEDIFISNENDTLFWCYYVIQHGLLKYQMLSDHRFEAEKTHKIDMVDLIRQHKKVLKTRKCKLAVLEDDLVNKNRISVPTFLCFCIVQNLNVMIVKDKCCYINGKNEDIEYILEKIGDRYGLYLLDGATLQKKKIDFMSSCLLIDNWNKPLKGITNYKLKPLQEICTKFGLPITYCTSKGVTRNIKKLDLYNSIKQVL
jgi:hypothetical protein